MWLQQVLLVVVISFFACATLSESATQTGISSLGFPGSVRSTIVGRYGANERSLRTDTTTAKGEESSEDRGIVSSIKVRWWLETEKSDDYVKEALKLKGLKGTDLTTHKNYKAYQYFAKKSEEYRLNKWLREEFTTYQVWEKQGLARVITLSQLKSILKTENFRVYKRYVNGFDTDVLRTMRAGYDPPAVMVSRGATEAEMTARTVIMAEAGRSAKYAKLALGMTESTSPNVVLMSGERLKSHADFKFFQLFLSKREPALQKERKALESLTKLSSGKKKRLSEVKEELDWVKMYVKSGNGGGAL